MSWITKLQYIYKKYQRRLLYVDLVIILVVFYFGNYFEWVKNVVLPAAIVSALAIIIEILFSMSNFIESNYTKEYKTVGEVLSKIVSIIQNEEKAQQEIIVVGSSGGTTINVMIQNIIDTAKSPFKVSLLIANPESKMSHYFPDHWALESETTINRLKSVLSEKPKNLVVECFVHDFIPSIAGILINEKHLFLGAYVWNENNKKMSAQFNPLLYFFRSPENETQFKIFESWFYNSPKTKIKLIEDEN